VFIVLSARPSFLVTPRDKVVGVGRQVSIRCEVTGSPMPAVFWNKANSQVGNVIVLHDENNLNGYFEQR